MLQTLLVSIYRPAMQTSVISGLGKKEKKKKRKGRKRANWVSLLAASPGW